MFSEFKAFIMRGNVLDLAVAVIIGGAFGKIVTSLVNDLIMPPVGLLLGNVDFSNLFVSLSGVAVRLAGRGPEGRRGDAQLRPLHQRGGELPDHRLRDLPGRARGEPSASAAAAARRGAHDARLPALPVDDPAEGDALRALHAGAPAGLSRAR